MKLTALLRHSAGTYPEKSERLHTVTDKVEELVRKRYSVSRTVREMERFAHDKELVRLIVDTFRAMPELPSLAMRDYKPYIALIACTPEDFAYCYLCNDLVAVYESEFRTRELMFFCDMLRCLRGRSYLNCVINRVCDYFFRARRDALRHSDTPLAESEMQYAESRMKELDKAVFKLKVRMYKWHTFTAEELAAMCHISETHLRRVFRDCMQMSPVEYINWVRIRTACGELKRTNDTVGDIAVRCGFSTLSTFNRNFHRIMGISPQQWRKDPEHFEQKLLKYDIKAEKGW